MLLILLHRFRSVLDGLELYSSGNSAVFLTLRSVLAGITGFILVLMFAPMAIRFLTRHCGERIAGDSALLNELHSQKNRTPTMGGIFLLAGMLLSVILWGDLGNPYLQAGIGLSIGMGLIGGIDDWIKIRTLRKGLSVRQKLAAQALLSAIVCFPASRTIGSIPNGFSFIWPFGNIAIPLGSAFVLWGVFVLIGSSNGVNLTDGLDGLAGGCLVTSGLAMSVVCYFAGEERIAADLEIPFVPGCGELCVLLSAMVGGTLGFLWFNRYPAQVFMGDTGSLPLGGVIGLAGLISKQETLLAIIGGVFVVETLSVILQVGWFKLTRRRVFACSPLHNHFVFRGLAETKIVLRFWIVSLLAATLGLVLLKV